MPGLTYADYAAIPEDGRRHEILDGEQFVTPAPTPLHQWVSKRLQRQLEEYFEQRSLGVVFDAPIDLILADGDIVQADLVVARRQQISDRAIEGTPLLVVEILSPSTRDRDRRAKARRYAQLGVPHYWIVDPDARRIECRRLESGTFREAAATEGSEILRHPDWEGLAVDLGQLWL